MKTSAQAATQLNLAARTVQKWCKNLGFEKIGRDYALTASQIDQIAAVDHKPGRPKLAASE